MSGLEVLGTVSAVIAIVEASFKVYSELPAMGYLQR
jgi:hypothetical protein